MLKKKESEVKKQIRELLNNVKPDLYNMVSQAGKSGALADDTEISQLGNYLLAKAIITIHFNKQPYGPLTLIGKKEVDNLAYFI